ncbi:MAG: 2-methylcitrate dehydratase [Caballeronia sp.]|nr:2-methylcitrate dehydratase [Caballeronia sp.]
MTIAAKLADSALRYDYSDLSEEVRDVAKRLIVDAIGCTLGGYATATGKAVRDFAAQPDLTHGCTLIGSLQRAAISPAIIANQAMLRYLDYNDAMMVPIGPGNMAATHPSGALPVALALCERERKGGRDLITAMVAGYEVMATLLRGFQVSLEYRGFHNGCVHAYGGAAMAGYLLRVPRDQLANAMGIAGSLSVGLDILDAEGEEYTMTKNLADGMIAERGYVAVELARRGMTGPTGIIEGNKGFARVVLGGEEKFAWPEQDTQPLILTTFIKGLCAEATTHGHLRATLALAAEHDIAPGSVEKIVIRTSRRAVHHTGDPVKKYPRNKETADHSSFFLTAMALLERRITPAIYSEANYADPRVRALIDKTELEHGPEFDSQIPAAEVTIRLNDGRTLTRRVEKSSMTGDPRARMADAALKSKFIECAGDLMPESQIDRIIECCLRLDTLEEVGELIRLTKVSERLQ